MTNIEGPTDPLGRPALTPGVPVRLTPLVRRVLAPNPGMMSGPGTNTYLVGTDQIVVIDPGPDDAGHLDAVAEAGAGKIAWIIATHTHLDHSPGVAGLKERTGAEALAFDSRDGLVVDRQLADGDRIEADDFELIALHTPGHASNHLCYLLPQERLLFSGDHIMDGSTVVINPPDGDMAHYLESLRKVQALDLTAIAPGHGHLIEDPSDRIEDYITHRLERESEVLAALREQSPATAEQLVPGIYADVPDLLHPVAARSVWAHLRKLGQDGLVECDDPNDVAQPWLVATK